MAKSKKRAKALLEKRSSNGARMSKPGAKSDYAKKARGEKKTTLSAKLAWCPVCYRKCCCCRHERPEITIGEYESLVARLRGAVGRGLAA